MVSNLPRWFWLWVVYSVRLNISSVRGGYTSTSLIALPTAHLAVQHMPPLHLLIEGLHRVLFQAVGKLLTALGKGFGRLLLVTSLASCQQKKCK